jgi:hypothetical protein
MKLRLLSALIITSVQAMEISVICLSRHRDKVVLEFELDKELVTQFNKTNLSISRGDLLLPTLNRKFPARLYLCQLQARRLFFNMSEQMRRGISVLSSL